MLSSTGNELNKYPQKVNKNDRFTPMEGSLCFQYFHIFIKFRIKPGV